MRSLAPHVCANRQHHVTDFCRCKIDGGGAGVALAVLKLMSLFQSASMYRPRFSGNGGTILYDDLARRKQHRGT